MRVLEVASYVALEARPTLDPKFPLEGLGQVIASSALGVSIAYVLQRMVAISTILLLPKAMEEQTHPKAYPSLHFCGYQELLDLQQIFRNRSENS
jgi:hypothetical protein